MAGSTPGAPAPTNGGGGFNLDILEMIGLAASLFKIIADGKSALEKIKTAMARTTELTPEEREAWQKVMDADHAKPAWQAGEDVPT